jgi:hypothetical protein
VNTDRASRWASSPAWHEARDCLSSSRSRAALSRTRAAGEPVPAARQGGAASLALGGPPDPNRDGPFRPRCRASRRAGMDRIRAAAHGADIKTLPNSGSLFGGIAT